MSAAVNDRPHSPFSLPATPHLPLTGELHPLRREFERWLVTGNAITITLAIVVSTVAYLWPRQPVTTTPPRFEQPFNKFGSYDPKPPVAGRNESGFKVTVEKPEHFFPDPVNDLPKDDEPPSFGGDGFGEPGPGPVGDPYGGGPFDSLFVPTPPARPEDFIPFDREPELVSIVPADYPEMVRDAGIDGTVVVRAFIGLNGRVKQAYVAEGPRALHEAALASARTAVFKPALQGQRPVEVWMAIPITFQLHSRW